jgi:hypothetical protein
MRQVSITIIVWLVFILSVSGIISACNSGPEEDPSSTPIVVWEFKNQTAFDTVYPEGWENFIVKEGFLVFGPHGVTYLGESGPTMSIIRQPPGTSLPSLEEELSHFLEFGPLREDYFLISDINDVKMGQYDGLEVAVEREATEMFIAMKGVISVVKTESGSLYTFIATAPADQWDASWPLLLTITQNITFNE